MINWLVGPQMIGLICLIAGWIMNKYPPKRINPMYGYRTALSMRNQRTWDEANRYSSSLMIKIGWVLIGTGVLTSILFDANWLPEFFRPILLIGGSVLLAVILIAATETHLKRTFPKNEE